MKRVYFIRSVDGRGPIKIGCSANPAQRLRALSRRHTPLEIAAVTEGGFFTERQFHTLFREDHIGGEWFAPSDRLLAAITAIAAGHFDVSVLPAYPIRLPRKAIEYTAERRAKMAEAARRNNAWLAAYRSEKAVADAAGTAVSGWAIAQRLAQSVRAA